MLVLFLGLAAPCGVFHCVRRPRFSRGASWFTARGLGCRARRKARVTGPRNSTTWKQKLSVALATQIAIGAQCRAPLLTRQRAMGEGVDVEGGEVQGRVYEGVAEGRAPSGMSV